MDATFSSFDKSLTSIFTSQHWTDLQYQSYQLINEYVEEYQEKNRVYSTEMDKKIISGNLRDQLWFKHSKGKAIMSQLLDFMTLEDYHLDYNKAFTNFILSLSFRTFKIHVCLYKNDINKFINYYVFFERQEKKAYLAYYIEAMGMDVNDHFKKIKLPEFEKIYRIIDVNPQTLFQYELINFFSEIIMYYDDSEILGNLSIGNSYPVTLNSLINKSNEYIHQKNIENQYTPI